MLLRLFIVTFFAWNPPAWSAVEVDEHGSTRISAKTANSGREMRGSRRAGIGLLTGGLSGVFGANLEINFTQTFALNAGGGFSSDFQSLFIGGKHVLGGKWIMPYGTYGYARWFRNGGSREVGTTTPGFVADKFLSAKERETGIFSENLIFGGLGVQYLQLSGDWAGSSVYIDAHYLVDFEDFVGAPTLGAGYIYYF
jgi:hypothetical protein